MSSSNFVFDEKNLINLESDIIFSFSTLKHDFATDTPTMTATFSF